MKDFLKRLFTKGPGAEARVTAASPPNRNPRPKGWTDADEDAYQLQERSPFAALRSNRSRHAFKGAVEIGTGKYAAIRPRD